MQAKQSEEERARQQPDARTMEEQARMQQLEQQANVQRAMKEQAQRAAEDAARAAADQAMRDNASMTGPAPIANNGGGNTATGPASPENDMSAGTMAPSSSTPAVAAGESPKPAGNAEGNSGGTPGEDAPILLSDNQLAAMQVDQLRKVDATRLASQTAPELTGRRTSQKHLWRCR
jgi:hypothetical protein